MQYQIADPNFLLKMQQKNEEAEGVVLHDLIWKNFQLTQISSQVSFLYFHIESWSRTPSASGLKFLAWLIFKPNFMKQRRKLYLFAAAPLLISLFYYFKIDEPAWITSGIQIWFFLQHQKSFIQTDLIGSIQSIFLLRVTSRESQQMPIIYESLEINWYTKIKESR